MGLKGQITCVSFDEIYGWARFSDNPYHAPLVQATLDGKVVADGRANLIHNAFMHLGPMVAACAFMLDVSHLRLSKGAKVVVLVDGEALPGAAVEIPFRPSEQEVHIEPDGVAHVFTYRRGQYKLQSNEPLARVFLYSRSRRLEFDIRYLGVLIGGLLADGIAMAMQDQSLFEFGFYAPEQSCNTFVRWTNGRASLLFGANSKPSSLSFEVYALSSDRVQTQN